MTATGRYLLIAIGTLPAMLAADTITYRNDRQQTETIDVNVIHETEQGDLLAESADGRQWTFRAHEIQSRRRSDKEIPLWGRDELVTALKKEYPSGFEVLQTKNYIVVYSTNEPFARMPANSSRRSRVSSRTR